MSGFLYRPVRETSVEKLIGIAEESRENTGINKIWLIGFAVSDYSRINDLIFNSLINKLNHFKLDNSLLGTNLIPCGSFCNLQ